MAAATERWGVRVYIRGILKGKWYACPERERGYCSSRKRHTRASTDSLVAIRPILICKSLPAFPPVVSSWPPPLLTHHSSGMQSLLHHYLCHQCDILIWNLFLAKENTAPFPLQPTSPLTWEENLTQVVRGIINLSNFNKCVCFALYFHIVVCI